MGPAKLADPTATREPLRRDHEPSEAELAAAKVPHTREELALGLRGVAFFAGHEYRQLDPVWDIADRVLAMERGGGPPLTPGPPMEGVGAGSFPIVSTKHVRPQWIIPPFDNRWPANSASVDVNCREHAAVGSEGGTMTRVSRSTAISAAHVFYGCYGWRSTTNATYWFGANTPTGASGPTAYLTWAWPAYRWITIPSAFIDNFDCASSNTWDYAAVDFGQDLYQNYGVAWYPTVPWTYFAPGPLNHYTRGYPNDKKPPAPPWGAPDHNKPSMWSSIEYSTIEYRGVAGQFKTYVDWVGGNSGGCIFDVNNFCFGIVVEQSPSPNQYNVGRSWDSAIYNFMDAYSAFPF